MIEPQPWNPLTVGANSGIGQLMQLAAIDEVRGGGWPTSDVD
jgi:hypothetical protein